MKSMLFAAGKGTRLRPLTDAMPKALVPVDGRPLLALTLEKLCKAGVDEAVVNVHHFGEQIIDYLQTHDFGIRVTVSDERAALLNTGGGLRRALPLFSEGDDPVLVHNVDILSNADLAKFYAQNRTNAATLLVSERSTSRYLLFDDEMALVGWTNVVTGEVRSPYPHLDVESMHRYAFSGIHLFSPHLREMMLPFPEVFSIIDFYLSVCDRVKICGHFSPHLRLLDVGKVETLAQASAFLKTYGPLL